MIDWVTTIIDRLGVVGVALVIALENLIPPIPSEVVLPLAGFRARTGALNPIAVWAGATVGSLAGALLIYGLGHWLGFDRLHRLAGHRWFVLVSQDDLERGQRVFERHGSWIVAAARCLPVLRSVVSIPAGIARMPLVRFSLLTVLGSGVWNAAFVAAGWLLAENWQRVESMTGPVGIVVMVALGIGLVILAWRRHRNAKKREAEANA